MPFTVAEIAKHLQGELLGDATVVLNGFAPADRAQSGDLTFAENAEYFARAEQSAASAIIVDAEFASRGRGRPHPSLCGRASDGDHCTRCAGGFDGAYRAVLCGPRKSAHRGAFSFAGRQSYRRRRSVGRGCEFISARHRLRARRNREPRAHSCRHGDWL